jgi:hypothetical protein
MIKAEIIYANATHWSNILKIFSHSHRISEQTPREFNSEQPTPKQRLIYQHVNIAILLKAHDNRVILQPCDGPNTAFSSNICLEVYKAERYKQYHPLDP